MKKILFVLFILPLFSFAQYVFPNSFVENAYALINSMTIVAITSSGLIVYSIFHLLYVVKVTTHSSLEIHAT